ncbi:MAG TPA: class I SAM-dependent methyltransferase [Actinomycetota bacterium]|nr:class I SAM-dependent methyltransferase [Actinomycetota bacterium]
MSGSVHETAATGFGAAADEYERSRPGYPQEAVDVLIRQLRIATGRRLLELGAGTGKLTRRVAGTGADIVAVEPVESMRRRFAEELPGVPVIAATAETLPFEDETFDAAAAAQAFHWFDGDRALAELHRVLRPEGRLGLMWNVRDESVNWVAALTELIDPYERTAPRFKTGEWRVAFEETKLFGDLHHQGFPNEQSLDADGLVTRIASVSFIARLPEGERHGVLDRIRQLAETHPDLRGRERFSLPYVTDVYWCDRRD